MWFDLTNALEWRGRPVGTVRVARELAAAMSRVLPESRFATCVWLDGRYVECDETARRAVEERANRRRRRPRRHEPDFSATPRAPLFVSALVSLAPTALRPVVRRLAGAVARATGALLAPVDGLRRGLRGSAGADTETAAWNPDMPFSPGDVLVTVDIDWRNRLVPRLERISRELGVRIVTCCYDMIPVVLPHCAKENIRVVYPSLVTKSARASELVLCISRQTRSDLLEFLAGEGVPAPETAVIRLGDELPVDGGTDQCRLSARLDAPFILFVSTVEPRKNHATLYRAYRLLIDRGLGGRLPVLVFCGSIGWHVEDLLNDLRSDPLLAGKLLLVDDAEDDELEWLYRNARFCLYPSLYEGWGLPVAEALLHGRAVLCSEAASLPEVGGDLVRYVDPWCPHAWAEAILDWVDNPSVVAEWEGRIREEYKPAKWDQTAAQVVSAVGFDTGARVSPGAPGSRRIEHD